MYCCFKSSRTMPQVHKAKLNLYCSGVSFAIIRYNACIWAPVIFAGLPNSFFAFNASIPPSRYAASHVYILLRSKPTDFITTSGLSPASTRFTEVILICSSASCDKRRPSLICRVDMLSPSFIKMVTIACPSQNRTCATNAYGSWH